MLRLKRLPLLFAAFALPLATATTSATAAVATAATPATTATTATPATAASAADAPKVAAGGTDHANAALPAPTEQTSSGSVSVGGRRIDYQAVTGTLVVHPEGWSDAPQEKDSKNPDRGRDDVLRRVFRERREGPASVRSPSSTTAVPAHRPYGCTWVRSVRGGS